MASIADTIVATATPPGTGGVGIVRVSGGEAERIARGMLGSLPEPRTATHRSFRSARGDKLDAGIALYFPAPASFTGESVLELHGHGGPVVMSLLVDAAVGFGARLAEPGEFTKRAFLNGKLDLAQAEAVADLIGSGTEQAARAALRSLAGAFSRESRRACRTTRASAHARRGGDRLSRRGDRLSHRRCVAVAARRLWDSRSTS